MKSSVHNIIFGNSFQSMVDNVASLLKINRKSKISLEESNNRLHKIINSMPDGVVIVNSEGNIQSINNAALHLFGYNIDELTNQSVDHLFADLPNNPSEKSQIIFIPNNCALPLGKSVETNGRHRNNSIIPLSVTTNELNLDDQLSYIIVLRDISQSKYTESMLRIEHDRAQLYLDIVEVVIVAMDLQGRITQINRKGCQALGVSEHQLLNTNFFSLCFEKQDEIEMIQDYSASIVQNELFLEYFQCHFKNNDGLHKIFSWHNSLIYSKDHVVIGCLCAGHDITEQFQQDSQQRELQHKLSHAEKMKSLGQLTGGIAHDFNNMLASILGYSDLAVESLQKGDSTDLLYYCEQINNAGGKARDLVKQMLIFSRGGQTTPEPLLISPLIEESITMLRAILPTSMVIHTHLDKTVAPVLIDSVNLQQIIMNLCINARDAMQGSGELNVTVKTNQYDNVVCSSCQAAITGSFVELSVTDNGPGIDQANIAKIFQPFFSTKQVGKGTGMGLSVVHDIIHTRDGHLLMESTPLQGTTFRVLFNPAKEQIPDTKNNITATETPVFGKGNILVVDDEISVGNFLKELLESRGFKVTTMFNSVEAVNLIKQEPQRFDLVLTDQTMPGLTGVELVKQVKSLRPDLPIILCTGYSEYFNDSELIATGIAALIKKPMESRNLLNIINNELNQDDSKVVNQ